MCILLSLIAVSLIALLCPFPPATSCIQISTMPVLHFWLTDVVFVYSQHLLKVEQHFWPCLCLFIHACFDFLVAHDCCREWCIAYFPNTTIHLLITMCVLLLPIFESLHAFLVGSLTMLIFVMFVQKQSWLGQQVLDDDNNDDGDTG